MHANVKRFWHVSHYAQSQQGVSLLEILIAMAVVFLALMGFAGFSVVAHTGMSASYKMTQAVTLAQEKMEDIQREGVLPGFTHVLNITEPYGSISGALHHQRILTMTPDDPLPGLHTVTVDVEWDHGAHTISLKTYLTQE